MNKINLNEVNNLCHKIGQNRLIVQGAGGNISWKEKDNLYVKASGFNIGDANKKNIFTKIKYKDYNSGLIESNFKYDINKAVFTKKKYKPSIEAAFHSIIPQKYILHVHSIEILSRLVQKNAFYFLRKYISDKTLNWKLIKYVKPGNRLAKAIYEELKKDTNTNIFFLKNHGIIIGSNNLKKILPILNKLSKDLKSNFKIIKKQKPRLHKKILLKNKYELKSIKSNEIQNLSLKFNLFKILKKYWRLYPDQIVFLGSKPIIFNSIYDLEKSILKIANINFYINVPIFIRDIGTFYISRISKPKIIQLVCYYDVLIRQKNLQNIDILNDKQVKELLNWDQEKYRIKITQN